MKLQNYGELLSAALKKPLLAYQEYGSYQGDYLAILDAGENVEIWKGGYGSCSGCDWLEAEREWKNDYEIPEAKIHEYVKDERPFLAIPKHILRDMTLDTFKEIIPANTRKELEKSVWNDVKINDVFNLSKSITTN